MVNVGIFYDHLEYFMAIWYNLWLFGIVCGNLLYFSRFGMFGPRKIWQPCSELDLASSPSYVMVTQVPILARAIDENDISFVLKQSAGAF
jgi:hypothetical protein